MLLLLACAAPDDALVVRWIPGAGDDDRSHAEAGLWWALSQLGATPPADGHALVRAGDEYTLDLAGIGLPPEHLPDLEAAVAPVAAWADGPVDLGLFLLAVLYEPGRYYAITGACPTLGDWEDAHLVVTPEAYAVTLSQLVDGERLVRFNPMSAETVPSGFGFRASEGEGSLTDGTFDEQEFEVVDVMPNGQQRFAVYGPDGDLRAAAATTAAGQPGRCMWCHEMTFQRGTPKNPSADGYVTADAFLAELAAGQAALDAARAAVPSAIQWDTYAQHEWAERLTRSYLAPSTARVAAEWGVDEAEVAALDLPTHLDEEYPELGPLHLRADVDAARMDRESGWAPYPGPMDDRFEDPDRALVGTEELPCE